ncbi:uncharacterized protein Z520_02589 [Fonsecaea multimorphosa CBS 102226]|uniref:DUF6604 domain-containing protein n=1 Tax=Fonsecaea multimorphosa CBS 102226 TaxID=1442371 RepID=A0A0D2KG94_9EURO|nr:uncharacterized protein Z520_02589 [Fonsecaea multimorphosa CBS 102226]KIY02450.1 hypothetical protein Z520_02589 [Fonsecaea multimorphosa CBS 102226]OAL29090.1 hypothetical protein AYO22_02527 [Fonsecaea multimorphosa]
MAILDPEYGKMYSQYKQATDNVLCWMRALYNRPSTIPLNDHLQLAVSAVRDGIRMPENMAENLATAFELRKKTAEFHSQSGTSDHGHNYMITVLQTISTIFSLSRPATPEPTSACATFPAPAPYRQEHLTPRPLTPPQQGYLPPFPFQQEWCPPSFCAYDHLYQYQQQPYGTSHSPAPSPSPSLPPPPGLYPLCPSLQPQSFHINPAFSMSTHSIDMPASMFERAPGY